MSVFVCVFPRLFLLVVSLFVCVYVCLCNCCIRRVLAFA